MRAIGQRLARAFVLVALSCVPHEDPPTNGPLASPRREAAVAAEVEAVTASAPIAATAMDDAAESRLPDQARIVRAEASSGLPAFVASMAPGGLVWVGPLAGNGGRDVLVYIPPGARPAREFQLVVHFHGTHSERIQAKAPGLAKKIWVGWDRLQQTIDAVDELQSKREYNVALAYPLSAGKRREPGKTGWFNKEYDRMWMKPAPPEFTDSFEVLHGEVVAILRDELGVHPSKLKRKALVEGHSAGGMPLLHIARSGTTLVGEYLFLDASFQGWADGCWDAVRASGSGALVSVVITAGGIADPFGKRDPWCAETPATFARWQAHGQRCRNASDRVKGDERSCGEIELIADAWQASGREWCEHMTNDMRELAGVYLLRTKVPHGKQPRHFVGGLELPAERARDSSSQGRLPSTR